MQRLIDEAFANDIQVAVCSTSNDAAVSTIVKKLLGPTRAAKMRFQFNNDALHSVGKQYLSIFAL